MMEKKKNTHEHGHEHDKGCACDHEHEEGCACGHEHVHDESSSPIPLLISIGLFVLGFTFEHIFHLPELASIIAFGLSALISGHKVFLSGLKGLIKFNFNENVLMTIAIVTAFCLGDFSEAAMVAILFSLGEIAEGVAERNSRRSIRALTEIRPDTARILTDDGEVTVAANRVKTGDLVTVNPFERVPVDGVITFGSSYVDNSALTGESVPISVSVGDEILSGSVNGAAKITVRSTANFEDSTSSRILKLIEDSSVRKGDAEKLITRFAKIYTPIVIGLAILVTLVPPLLGMGPIEMWLYRALVMLVASCPCALVISVPLGFFAGIGAQSSIGVLIKGGKYVEALARTNAVILDKTGTITTSKLKISKITSAGFYSSEEILSMAASAEVLSTHPVGRAICEGFAEIKEAGNICEIPGKGITAVFDGHKLVVGRRLFLHEMGVATDGAPDATVYVAADGALAGSILLSDTVRADSPGAIKALRAMGIKRIVMLTGDNEASAKEVSDICGITEYKASLLPGDKADFILSLPEGGRIFVGDGVNDAPVLAAADCGVAMGLGSQAAIETGDVVLSSGTLSVLPHSIRLARRAMGVIHFNIIFAISFKVVVLVLAAIGWAPMWFGIISDVGVMLFTVLNAMRLVKNK